MSSRNRKKSAPCIVQGCDRQIEYLDSFCPGHYKQYQRYGKITCLKLGTCNKKPRPACSVEGCTEQVNRYTKAKLCTRHYNQRYYHTHRSPKNLSELEGIERKMRSLQTSNRRIILRYQQLQQRKRELLQAEQASKEASTA